MAFSSFVRKTVQDILKQIEKMKPTADAGSTFNGKRFNGFGIAAIVGAGILVQLVRLTMEALL
jgi:transcription initiation factor TFIIIB Brf1 subunit/transcription initiation factor TFIIB